MDLIDFVNNYWTILAGICSFIFAAAYTYFTSKQTEKDRAEDYKDLTDKLKEQKENHDQKIAELQVKAAANETKIEGIKDQTFAVISLIQQDIREIMTILKRDK